MFVYVNEADFEIGDKAEKVIGVKLEGKILMIKLKWQKREDGFIPNDSWKLNLELRRC